MLRGGTVVVYFYPRADTPGCTTQACGVRDRGEEYAAMGARVIGISPDEVEAIGRFAGKYDLGFTLLADPDHAVAEQYGAWGEKNLYGNTVVGLIRSTFVIDEDGVVTRAMRNVRAQGNSEKVLAALP